MNNSTEISKVQNIMCKEETAFRKKEWDKLFRRFSHASMTSPDVCFNEVNDDILFISRIGSFDFGDDDDVEMKEDITTGFKHGHKCPEDLINYIEHILKSDLKWLLDKRAEGRILENLEYYSYWHKQTKQEMTRLTKHISSSHLKTYMSHCNMNKLSCPEEMRELIKNEIQVKLKKFFVKREFWRNVEHKYAQYNNKVSIEWKRLTEVIQSFHFLIFYAAELLHHIKLSHRSVFEKMERGALENQRRRKEIGHLDFPCIFRKWFIIFPIWKHHIIYSFRDFTLDTKSAIYREKCPLCLKPWIIPTVLQVSGYIFCFRCILRHLNEDQRCPVSNLPAKPLDIVRLYIE